MATIVNIFGKLYTFLRRQEVQTEVDNHTDSQDADATPNAGGDNQIKDSREIGTSISNTVRADSEDGTSNGTECLDKPAKGGMEKLMTDSVGSNDWEHIPMEGKKADDPERGAGDSSGSSGKTTQPTLLNLSVCSGTDVDTGIMKRSDKVSAETASVDVENENSSEEEARLTTDVSGTNEDEKSQETPCSEKEAENDNRDKDEPKEVVDSNKDGSQEVVVAKQPKHEKDFSTYMEYVLAMTTGGFQIDAKDLFYKLGYEKNVSLDTVGEAVMGQYKLASSRNNWVWVKNARYFAELFFAPDWIDQNLPHKDVKSNRKNRPSKKKKQHNVNEQFENPGGICRDFRLKQNPNLETITANAANNKTQTGNVSRDGAGELLINGVDQGCKTEKHGVQDLLTDYTDQVIQEAMKMAIGDGLSESAIMEVIEDVTASAVTSATPQKPKKLVKVDLSRTPRSRPDQLAVGFSYHSDLVVKESPKTVNGEIIPLDLLPPPRERPEQLAVGFSYLAEQLVKDSPRTESGEVLIPGVVASPRRLPRDQLALGFSYHSDLIAKESPSDVGEQKSGSGNFNDLGNRFLERKEEESITLNGFDENTSDCKPLRYCKSDTFAVGFSYNSDLMVLQAMNNNTGKLQEDNVVSSLIEDAVINEGRNTVEFVEEIPVGLPAGSVW